MSKKVKYFGCAYGNYNGIKDSKIYYIGTNKKQVKNTIEYYIKERGQVLDIPSDSDISELTEINISCALPLAHMKQNLRAEIRNNVIFWINANAFDYVQRVSQNYEGLKRGDLFKFVPGVDFFGLFFLPEYIMEGLRDYDWGRHMEQVRKWLGRRETILNEGEQRGKIHRERPRPYINN